MIKMILLLMSVSLAMANSITGDIAKLAHKHGLNLNQLGIIFKDQNNQILYENRSEQLMIPASLSKIVTAGAVLSNIPLNHKFMTGLYSNAAITADKILSGNLCLKGGGDPGFVSENMWFLVNELTRKNITAIQGDLIVDDSLFDKEYFDNSRESTRVDRAYDAPVSALSFNWNSTNIYVSPADKIKSKARVILDPQNSLLELDNRVMTSAEGGETSLATTRDENTITVTGTIPLDAKEALIFNNIGNPPLWAGYHLKEFLLQRKIQLQGKILAGVCSENAIQLAVVKSKNLIDILSDMLKYSNNFVAEMLVKNLAVKDGSTATMKKGIDIINQFLINKVGLKSGSYTFINPAGFTRHNQMSAKEIVQVLQFLQNDFRFFPEFLAGLPIGGIDGTLLYRMGNRKPDKKLNKIGPTLKMKDVVYSWEQENRFIPDFVMRAKTGYLDGVSGLAGFLQNKNGKIFTFTMMYNGNYEGGIESKKFFDDVAKYFATEIK